MKQQVILALLVGAGGAAGSISRYGVSLYTQRLFPGVPLGTLAVNVLGCFVIGVVAVLAERGGVPPQVRLTLATGLCGGFTTMSSMILETAGMLKNGSYATAAAYIGGTLLLSMGAFVLGTVMIRCVVK